MFSKAHEAIKKLSSLAKFNTIQFSENLRQLILKMEKRLNFN